MTINISKYNLPEELQDAYLSLMAEISDDIIKKTGVPAPVADVAAVKVMGVLLRTMEIVVQESAAPPEGTTIQ